jgi:hypothetical protein
MSGVEVQLSTEDSDGTVAVRVLLRLTPRERSRLFTSGDALIHLPTEGVVLDDAASPVPRTGLFLSELAEMKGGFRRAFSGAADAAAFAASVRGQLDAAASKLAEP